MASPKQSRKTKARKNRQQATQQRAQALLRNWLNTAQGRRAQQLRDAAVLQALFRTIR